MAENILLYFSDTGRGHRSATEAVEEALKILAESEKPKRELNLIKEPVAEKTNAINRLFVEIYNLLLQKYQHLMKYYYDLIHMLKPHERESAYRLSRDYLIKNLLEYTPSVVVSMHPMTNHFIHRAMKELGIARDVKFLIVITDPNKNLWRGWGYPEADLIIAPNELVKEQLLEWSVPESRIKTYGMPINPEFLEAPTVSRSNFLSHMGLSPDKATLCINSGWAGGGNMLAAYRALGAQKGDYQVIFLCGQNQELYERAKAEAAQSSIPTAVLPFHDRMPDLMNAVDAMVTKAGGLTTFECVAKKLPMIIDVITPPMPQEAGTVDLLVEQGLAKRLRRPEDLAELAKAIKYDPERHERPLPERYCLSRTDAVFDIARTILKSAAQCESTGNFAPDPELSSSEMAD